MKTIAALITLAYLSCGSDAQLRPISLNEQQQQLAGAVPLQQQQPVQFFRQPIVAKGARQPAPIRGVIFVRPRKGFKGRKGKAFGRFQASKTGRRKKQQKFFSGGARPFTPGVTPQVPQQQQQQQQTPPQQPITGLAGGQFSAFFQPGTNTPFLPSGADTFFGPGGAGPVNNNNNNVNVLPNIPVNPVTGTQDFTSSRNEPLTTSATTSGGAIPLGISVTGGTPATATTRGGPDKMETGPGLEISFTTQQPPPENDNDRFDPELVPAICIEPTVHQQVLPQAACSSNSDCQVDGECCVWPYCVCGSSDTGAERAGGKVRCVDDSFVP